MAGTILSSGSFSATGVSPSFAVKGDFGLQISGTFVGTVVLERSLDDGANWIVPTAAGNQLYSFTAPASEDLSAPEYGDLFRLHCTAYTSGTINFLAMQ
jgi:hypothetical protein